MERQNISSGVKFEDLVGYSRAVKIGNQIFVSGTTGVDYADSKSPPDAYSQAKKAIENIDATLRKLGSSLGDVVRTRVFIRSDVGWEAVAKAHVEAFSKIRPASTMISTGFLDTRILVEIEADAVV